MATVKLFIAKTVGKVGTVVVDGEHETIIARDGLTVGQAKALAARLNNQLRDADEEFKATRREQKFLIRFSGEFEVTSLEDADEFNGFYTPATLKKEMQEVLEDIELCEAVYSPLKCKVIVQKVYDKQVPNE